MARAGSPRLLPEPPAPWRDLDACGKGPSCLESRWAEQSLLASAPHSSLRRGLGSVMCQWNVRPVQPHLPFGHSPSKSEHQTPSIWRTDSPCLPTAAASGGVEKPVCRPTAPSACSPAEAVSCCQGSGTLRGLTFLLTFPQYFAGKGHTCVTSVFQWVSKSVFSRF